MEEPVAWHKDSCHHSNVLEMLQQFRTDGQLCDVTLKIDDHCIQAHRLVLAASSPYFQAMFMGGMQESQQNTVVMQGIDPFALDAMVSYAYTAAIKLDQENVESLLACANLLQVSSVANACSQFMASHLTPANCLGIWHLARLYSCQELSQQALRFARDHFKGVSEEAEFQLLPGEDLETLLACEDVAVACEEQVFKAVLEWAKFDPRQRASQLWSLLKYVAIPLLSSEFLLDQLETEPVLSQEGDVVSHLKRLQILGDEDSSVRIRGHRKKMKVLLALGGECEGCSLDTGHVFTEDGGAWSTSFPTAKVPRRPRGELGEVQFAPMESGRSAFGMACDGKQVFAAGGLSTSSESLDAVESYSVTDNSWSQAATMNERRHGCQACFLNNRVYVIGGHNGAAYTKTVERFCPTTRSLEYVAPLPQSKGFMGSAVLEGRIYVIGGTGSNGTNIYHNSVHYYDPVCDRWNTVTPLQEHRAYVGAAVVNGCIYVIGGFNGKWLKTVEKYDLRENRWVQVAPMKQERSSFGLSVMDGCIYVTGGFDGKRCLSTVVKYDPLADSWTSVANMPGSRYGIRLATLDW